MIAKYFYNEEDYEIVLKLLNGMTVPEEDRERVKTRQLFIMHCDRKEGAL